MRDIPITKVWIDEADVEAVLAPLRDGWLVQGPKVVEFEEKFLRLVGSEHAVATSSCTSALHLALVAAGIGPGDEVIVPAFTWVATANAVEYVGAKPVFCDIDLKTFNIDPNEMAGLITDRTRAIIPVHLFGLAADLSPIRRLSRWHDLCVIEDAACGLGARYKGRHVGTLGRFGCFSFHPRKAITTGEGGMLLTRSAADAACCRRLRDHGATHGRDAHAESECPFLLPEFAQLGYNYRLTDIQGALGSSQIEKADAILVGRAERARRYDDLLASFDWLRIPWVPNECEHAYQSYVCLFTPETPTLKNLARLHKMRNAVMRGLSERGVASRPGTLALTNQPYYCEKYGIRPAEYLNALIAEQLSIALPLYPQMSDDEQDYVIEHLASAFGAASATSGTRRRSRAA